MLLLFFFEVLRLACSVLRSHDMNSTWSVFAPFLICFLLAFIITAYKNSCWLTYWNLNNINLTIKKNRYALQFKSKKRPGSNLSFKVPHMPYILREISKSLNKWRFAMLIILWNEENFLRGELSLKIER